MREWGCLGFQRCIHLKNERNCRTSRVTEKDITEARQLLRHAGAMRQSNVDSLDRLRFQFDERFELAPSNLRAFISSVHRSSDAYHTFWCDQVGGIFIEIRKDDDLDHTLKIFQGEVGHSVAFLSQHALDRRNDAAEFHLPTIR